MEQNSQRIEGQSCSGWCFTGTSLISLLLHKNLLSYSSLRYPRTRYITRGDHGKLDWEISKHVTGWDFYVVIEYKRHYSCFTCTWPRTTCREGDRKERASGGCQAWLVLSCYAEYAWETLTRTDPIMFRGAVNCCFSSRNIIVHIYIAIATCFRIIAKLQLWGKITSNSHVNAATRPTREGKPRKGW